MEGFLPGAENMKKIKGILFDLEGALLAQDPGLTGPWRVAPGGLKVIRRLYDRGYRLGIVSRRSGEEVLGWLREEGLLQYFEAVQSFGAEGCQRACGQMGLELSECVQVTGDSDGEAGLGACILVTDQSENGGNCAVCRLADLPDLPIFQ